MIEMVPMAFRIADDLSRPPSYERTLLLDGENGAGGAGKNTKGSVEGNGGGKGKGSMDGKGGGSANGEEEGEERRREMVRRRLEGVGYRVGLGIVERFVDSPPLPFPILVPAGGAEQAPFAKGECGRGMHILLSTHEWSAYGFIYKLAVPEQLAGRGTSWRRHIRLTVPGFMGDSFSRDRPRFADTLDMIKFLCKDVWTLVFRKQIDNLKTNHRVGPPRFPFHFSPCCPSSLLSLSLPFPSFPLSPVGLPPSAAFPGISAREDYIRGRSNWLMMGIPWTGRLRPNRQRIPPPRAHEHGQSRGGGGEGAAGMFPSPFFLSLLLL